LYFQCGTTLRHNYFQLPEKSNITLCEACLESTLEITSNIREKEEVQPKAIKVDDLSSPHLGHSRKEIVFTGPPIPSLKETCGKLISSTTLYSQFLAQKDNLPAENVDYIEFKVWNS